VASLGEGPGSDTLMKVYFLWLDYKNTVQTIIWKGGESASSDGSLKDDDWKRVISFEDND